MSCRIGGKGLSILIHAKWLRKRLDLVQRECHAHGGPPTPSVSGRTCVRFLIGQVLLGAILILHEFDGWRKRLGLVPTRIAGPRSAVLDCARLTTYAWFHAV